MPSPALGVLGRGSQEREPRAGLGHLLLHCRSPSGVLGWRSEIQAQDSHRHPILGSPSLGLVLSVSHPTSSTAHWGPWGCGGVRGNGLGGGRG